MNANDQLADYTCTDNHYNHFTGILFTDGVRALCETLNVTGSLILFAVINASCKMKNFEYGNFQEQKGLLQLLPVIMEMEGY
jgi:hypothetical protein